MVDETSPSAAQYPGLTRYTFRFWLPMVQCAVYLIAGFEQRAGHNSLMDSVLKGNLLIALVTQLVFKSLPMVSSVFWYVIALYAVWYFAGFAIDAVAPRILRRDTHFPVRMMVLAGVIGLCTAYNNYCWAYIQIARITSIASMLPFTTQLAAAQVPPWYELRDWYELTLLDGAYLCVFLGLGWILERLLAGASRASAVTQRRILFGFANVLSGLVCWYAMHNSFDPEFTLGPQTRPDADLPTSFWLIYPFAQIGTLLLYPFAVRLGMFLSQRKHIAPGAELVWAQSQFVPRVRETLRKVGETWSWRYTVAVIAFVWCCGCVLVQSPTLAGQAVVVSLVLIYFLGWMFPRMGDYRWALLAMLVIAALLGKAGSYHLAVDIVIAAVVLAAVTVWFRRAQQRSHTRLQTKAFFAAMLCTWLLWSLGDAIFTTHPAPRDLNRFAALGAHQDSLGNGKRIGLALSGGGYRATLMHAGVLDGLEKLGLHPTNLSSVSGGSITASYYTAGGSPQELLHVFEHHRMLLYRDLIDAQNLVRLMFPARVPGTDVDLLPFYSFTRTDLNAQALDRVFLHNARFGDVGNSPRLMIDVTDLNSGRAIGTTGDWMLSRFLLRPPGEELFPNAVKLYEQTPRLSRDSTFALRNSGDQKLSKFASASAAFPLAFDPVPLNLGKLGRYLLSDGGITDNSAMTLLLEADRRASLGDASQGDPNWLLDLAISSDGGAMFTQANGATDQGFGRAIDIIDARIGLQLPDGPRGPQHPNAPPVVLLSPSLYVDNSRDDIDFSKFAFRYLASDYFYTLGPNGEQLPLNAEQTTLVKLIESQIVSLDADGLTLLASIQKGAPRDVVIGEQANELAFKASLNRIDDYVDLVQDLRDQPRKNDDLSLYNTPTERSTRHRVAIELLTAAIAEDFSRCLETFLNTPTLKDSFTPAEAGDLFRLGQYLVLLNENAIRRDLAGPAAADRATSLLNPAEQIEVGCAMADTIARPPDSPNPGVAMQQHFDWGEKSTIDYDNCMGAHGMDMQGSKLKSD